VDGGEAHGAAPPPDDALGLARRFAQGEPVELPPGTESHLGRPWIG
jgi:hypothetical protein